ncbi:MAG: ACT domain-containing protein [Clostridia bacterium]|nr:ACT domain-containing protein [Clostridia bacterium]
MRAVITVIGKDTVGILAKVCTVCANANVNVTEVTQTIQQDLFVMIMMVDMDKATIPFTELQSQLDKLGEQMGLKILAIHEEIFNAMHRI